jgi:zinc/manganese transport system permease protein
MAPAFFECLILVGIHSYLGIHVIKRKVIFVDLALAQVAALGTTVGFLFGIIPGTIGAYWFSLSFAILGAAIFSLSRLRNEKIPQEAVIGLVYAIAAALVILVIDKAPHGAEHIKELLTGSILWVKWETIAYAAIVYAGIGLFHFIFRKKFLLISNNPEKAYQEGISVRFWDFLFYVSFGIVITHSVGTAGVLLVFVFLVVPAITSILITDILWKQLVIGWSMGLVVSVLGLFISYIADLPSGPTVVAFYGIMLLIVALTLYVIRAENRGKSLGRIAIGLILTIFIFFVIRLLGTAFSEDHGHELEISSVQSDSHLSADDNNDDTKLNDISTTQLGKITDQDSLEMYFRHAKDQFQQLDIARRMVALNTKKGIGFLLELLRNAEYPYLREEVISEIEKMSHDRFGYDPEKTNRENILAFKRIERWIENNF